MKQYNLTFSILFILLLYPYARVGAQRYPYYTGGASAMYYIPTKDTVMAALGVTGIEECYRYYVKGKERGKPSCSVTEYDSLGQKTRIARYRKGKETWSASYTFYENGYIKEKVYRDHGKLSGSSVYTFDNQQRVTKFIGYNKGKLSYMNSYVYEGSKLQKQYYYEKDTVHYKFVYQNWYVGDTGDMTRAEKRNAKGKVLYVWDYNCNTHGEIKKVELKKESRICTSDTRLPNGYRLVQFDEITKEGARRYITEYDSLDRMIRWSKYEGKEGDKLMQQTLYNYTEQGKEQATTVYNTKTGKMMSQYEYHYNQNMQLLYQLSRFYNRKEKVSGSWEIQYTYEGDLLVRTRGTSLLQPGRESITEYSYTKKSN